MLFRQYKPSPPLSPYVKSYWVLESDIVPDVPERILPDGCPELVFHYGDKFHLITDKGYVEQPDALLAGQIRGAIRLQATGRTGMLGVRFYPWGLFPFMGVPGNELADKFIAMSDLFGNTESLQEQVCTSTSHNEMISHVEAFLCDKLKRQKLKYCYDADRFSPIIAEIENNVADVSVAGIAVAANMSIRQFNRKFTEVTGLSPKHFIRVTRVQRFINSHMTADTDARLMSLLYDCGYYDPAHFSHDFKDLAGVSPSSYFSELKDLGSAMLF